jgi:hypothetical protein
MYVLHIENYHNFERTEDRTIVFLKRTDFNFLFFNEKPKSATFDDSLHNLGLNCKTDLKGHF